MHQHLPLSVDITIVGAGLVTGLLFAFSNFALRVLQKLSPEAGMRAMQHVNLEIQNPLFFVLFFGTPMLCAAIVALAASADDARAACWLAGALCYLAGPFAIAVLCNVPLNNRLAKADHVLAALHSRSIQPSPATSCRWPPTSITPVIGRRVSD